MVRLRISPFKIDKIEDDPQAFGNRPKEFVSCMETLFNNKHVQVSGDRGIGKSSLAFQIKNLYMGNHILAERCGIKTKLDEYLTCFYTCGKGTTLSTMALDLLIRLKHKCKRIKSIIKKDKEKFEASLNLDYIKEKLQTDFMKDNPASIATQFINGLDNIYTSLINFTDLKGIVIIIDELDKLNKSVEFGHFFKIVHEYLNQDGLNNINFILVGQKGTFTHLKQQDPSTERTLKHVILKALNDNEARHILDYASSKKSETPFAIEPEAEKLILEISSGHPLIIQLLGDAAFSCMEDPTLMTQKDVLKGISKILKSDTYERYHPTLVTYLQKYNPADDINSK
jgi:deoxyadenosine/deoxycytidine kinase